MNEFYVDAEKNFQILFHPAASNDEMTYIRLDKDFRSLIKKELPLEYYADFNKMILLANGNTVIIDVDAKKNWRYSVYDTRMELLKRTETNLSQLYDPNQLREISNGQLEGIFVADARSIQDCVVQIVRLK